MNFSKILFLIIYFTLYLLLNSQEKEKYQDIEKIEFSSEYAIYNSSYQYIYLSTSVIINNLSKEEKVQSKIKAEDIHINLEKSLILIKSTFTFETLSSTISGSSGEFNFKTNTGNFKDSFAVYERFRVRGKNIIIKENKHIYKNASITTCDYEKPHYKISSQRLVFSEGRYFFSFNNIFYLGKVPIFYFPVFYTPLGKATPVMSQFYPGYDSRNGFYIKSTYTYKFSSYTKLKAFVDYFSKKGWGFGGEYYKYNQQDIKINFSYYTINEKGDAPVEWGANGGMWSKIYSKDRKEVYFQSFVRIMSYPDFNNNYFRTNPFAISNDKQAEVSLTYHLGNSYLRIFEGVKHVRSGNDFIEVENISPKIEYRTMPKKIKYFPFNRNLYLSFENSKINSNFFQKKMSLDYSLFNSMKISRNFSLYNSIKYSGNLFLPSKYYDSNTLFSKYYYTGSFRYSTISNSYELGYNGIFRAKVNRFSFDKDSSDRGIEKSELFYSQTLFSEIDRYLRLNTSYDIKDYDEKKSFRKRLNDVSVDYYKSFYNYEVYLKEVFNLDGGHKAFISQLNSNYEKNYLNIGFSNFSSNTDRFIISNTLGYYPSKKGGWYGEFVLRYYVDFSKDMKLNFYEKGIILNKEFHDFRTRFLFRKRLNTNEFFIYITMKMNDPYRKNEIDREVDEFFKPWRRFEEERDY